MCIEEERAKVLLKRVLKDCVERVKMFQTSHALLSSD